MKSNKTTIIMGYLWILLWLGAIWSPVYGLELFLTGIMALFIGVLEAYE